MPDNYVTLESMEFPGKYVGFTNTREVCNPQDLGPTDPNAQFFVRVHVGGQWYQIYLVV